jgi:ribonucleotide reductase beta subunit family protein with ferritin-like domain
MSKYLNIDNGNRDTKFPVLHDKLWKFYKKQQQKIWTAEELNLSNDTLEGIPEGEVVILKNLLAFFGVSDTLVQDNLADEIVSEFSSVEEIKSNYVYQAYIEDVHSETYSLLIEQLIENEEEKQAMFQAIQTNPVVASKVKWANKWLDNGDIIQRLVAFSLLEGMGFSSTFAILMFFRLRYPQLTGLGQANELILQDEVLHMHFGINMHNKYIKKEFRLPPEEIKKMIMGCYETEKVFVESIYSGSYVLGLPKDKLIQYIQYVTDSLLMYYDIDKVFRVEQPFDFMASFSIVERQNFFETKGGEYNRLTNIGGDLTTDDF